MLFSTHYQEELKLLERVYYKGKNQHRSALFWRKVSDIRRLSARINEINLLGLVDEFRHAFFAECGEPKLKGPRGAWRQTPDASGCASVLIQSKSDCLLVDQARSRLRIAHGAFTLQLRTATFIPLAISLIAITTRLDFLTLELRKILVSHWQAVAGVLENIVASHSEVYYRNALLPPDPFDPALLIPPLNQDKRRLRKRVKVSADHAIEDMGSRITRKIHDVIPSHTPRSRSCSVAFPADSSVDHPVTDPNFNALVVTALSQCKDIQPQATYSEVQTTPHSFDFFVADYPNGCEGSSRESESKASRSLRKQRNRMKRKRDVIDDIFGL